MADLELPAELVEDLEHRPRTGRRRIVTAVASAVLLVLVIAVGLPLLARASWAEILGALAGLPPLVLVGALALGLAALASEALALRAVVPGTRLALVGPAYAASSALGIAVPGGAILGTTMLAWVLRRAGLPAVTIVIGLLAFSLGDLAVSAVLVPLAGLAGYGIAGADLELPGTAWAAVLAVLGGLLAVAGAAALLARPVVVAIAERLAPLAPQARSVVGARDALMELLRRRGAALLGGQVLARIAHLLVLLLALEAVGADLPLAAVVAVFALGRVVAMLPLTPGGAGVTEAVGAASLIALGVPGADAAAASLLLMASTVLVPVAVGAAAAALGALRPGPRPASVPDA